MVEEQTALADDAFPLFVAELPSVGAGLDDYRVGMIDACPAPANLHTRGKSASDCAFESGQAWMDSCSSRIIEEFACVPDLYAGDYGPDIPGTCTGDSDDEQPANAAATALLSPHGDDDNAGFLPMTRCWWSWP